MKLILLIPALVSGFLFCHTFKKEYYKLHRYQGQYLYLRSTAIGLLFLIIDVTLYLFLHKYLPDNIRLCSLSIPIELHQYIEHLLKHVFIIEDTRKEAVFVLQAAVFTPVIAYLFALYLNRRLKRGYGEEMHLVHRLETQTSPMDRLLTNAFVDRSSLLFTLSSGKVYVGDVLAIPLPNESEKQNEEFTIVPIISGYRSDKHKVKFNTDYDASNLPIELQNIEPTVVFNKKDVVSVSVFDFKLYEHLNQKKVKEQTTL